MLKQNGRLNNRDSTLLIISHTDHFLSKDGKPHGWTPTIREIDFLARNFKEVIHLAVLQSGLPPESVTAYNAPNVSFYHIPPFGGRGWRNKLRILWVMPMLWYKMHKLIKFADWFQFRAPTSIGLMVIPVLTFVYPRKKGWYKYAGNWMQPDMPFSYRLQKWLLEKAQKRAVTINGQWLRQPRHVHTFENPCLSANELPVFNELGLAKKWQKPYTGCFVGRTEDAKGVHRLVELLNSEGTEKTIASFHFVGDGPKLMDYREQLKPSKVRIFFHGFCSREKTFSIYAQSNLFLLPSNSEGFPKVIAEAAAFGCVPIASDVSSIGQYVTKAVGYVWPVDQQSFTIFFKQLELKEEVLKQQSIASMELANKFTLEAYFEKLQNHVLKTNDSKL